MLQIRKSDERGHSQHSWLDSHHSFSFAGYYDPRYMGISHLRVINEDRVTPGGGFAPHSHRDMEIISYVLEGALEHRDSLGNSSVIRPGDVQRMSAGTGVTHSEYNASRTEPVHFLQIWIVPERAGIAPGYEQKQFPEAEKQGRLRLVASPDGQDGSVTLHQNARLYVSQLAAGQPVNYALARGRITYLQVARGEVSVNGQLLTAGDGVHLQDEATVELATPNRTEVLLFELA